MHTELTYHKLFSFHATNNKFISTAWHIIFGVKFHSLNRICYSTEKQISTYKWLLQQIAQTDQLQSSTIVQL